ncbi:MAG: 4-(cytidine 5'-diphospho)-2-C-methyl-D-erythritol kinase [Candidatus Rokubacteria bacterium]|nr:4-(cytidine 5'-diphospho)-2-C-methyl-D-erythritol kinase [Candidatus Rokubacteria bacterium]MBI3827021.1 4-(cytidine 5'-diphospho)-2-C-methyl-D-erythritol kinase [Candidatus Rokubacteria bacterium]
MLSAAAKVNLALEVLGKRADGYHEVATVMQAVDLSDRLVLEEADGLELRVTAPGIPTDGTNLALRAARALAEASGVSRGVRITLDKRIPAAAGLGGGSSDAAAVLLGLDRLWGLRWAQPKLAEVAVTLGMDVPFFLHGGAALGRGRGEQLERLAAGTTALVLVNPRFGSSTAEVYGRVTPAMYSDGARARAVAAALRGRSAGRLAATLYNGLEPAVAPVAPEIAQMKAALVAAGALGALMSGSGPTVLGICRSFEQARQIRGRLTRASWECWAVRTLVGPAIRFPRPAARAT